MSSFGGVDAAWRSHRPYLVNLAYQMLGDVGEAEDVAQEAFLRLARTDPARIDDIRAWLTVVAGRLCLDQMRSARVRHERPDGAAELDVAAPAGLEPADRVTLDVSHIEHQLVAEKFITACTNGDLQALTAALDPSVWGVGTILGAGAPPPQVNHGPRDVAVNLLRYLAQGATLVSGPAGQPVLLAFSNRRLFAVLVLTLRDGLIIKIEATVDPSAAERTTTAEDSPAGGARAAFLFQGVPQANSSGASAPCRSSRPSHWPSARLRRPRMRR